MSENTKTKNQGNKPIIITVCISVAVVIVLISVLALADPVAAAVRRRDVIRSVTNSDSIIVSAPLHSEKFPVGAEKILTEEQGTELRDTVISILENSSYKSSFESAGGFWDISFVFYVNGASQNVYLRDDGLYVTKGTKAYLFAIDKEQKETYAALLQEVQILLAQ